MERKSIPKKTRFEVFKRDKFTCQYCGRSAPDVILEVDHIDPVANGGSNDVLNLVTACSECNRGKGARTLDDDAVVKAQRRQLEQLESRREQIEMMYEWQKSLIDQDEDECNAVNELIFDITGFYASEFGIDKLRKHIRRFGYPVVLEAARIAFTQYEHGTDDEWCYAFDKIGGICFNMTHRRCSQCASKVWFNTRTRSAKCNIYGIVDSDQAETCEDFDPFYARGGQDA